MFGVTFVNPYTLVNLRNPLKIERADVTGTHRS